MFHKSEKNLCKEIELFQNQYYMNKCISGDQILIFE